MEQIKAIGFLELRKELQRSENRFREQLLELELKNIEVNAKLLTLKEKTMR